MPLGCMTHRTKIKDPSRFKRPKADTSRAKSPDVIDKYNFMSREAIESGIKSKEYLEHGEYNGNLYGLRFKSITQIINENKIVVLDVNPWVSLSVRNITWQHLSNREIII